MTTYRLTEKGKNVSPQVGYFNGEKYLLCQKTENGNKIWIKFPKEEQQKCEICGYSGAALEYHHIYGIKNSKETIVLCANCHRELHNK